MTQEHPITPPPELVKKIFGDALRGNSGQHDYELRLIHAAYAAGANQELEACCEWLFKYQYDGEVPLLRAARRPKPPSLKEQALKELRVIHETFAHQGLGNKTPALDAALKRLGELEALDD